MGSTWTRLITLTVSSGIHLRFTFAVLFNNEQVDIYLSQVLV